jgi:hypothetical protein
MDSCDSLELGITDCCSAPIDLEKDCNTYRIVCVDCMKELLMRSAIWYHLKDRISFSERVNIKDAINDSVQSLHSHYGLGEAFVPDSLVDT